jgi:prolyl-tRNA synthetase
MWPQAVAPCQAHLIALEDDTQVQKIARQLYEDLQKSGKDVLLDDRAGLSAGEKFADADLIGLPIRLVISKKTLQKKSAEIKKRNSQNTSLTPVKDVGKLF